MLEDYDRYRSMPSKRKMEKLNERQKCPSIFTPPADAGSRSEIVLDDRPGLS